MSIAVTCRCGKSFRVKDEHAGKKGKCPACGHTLLVPRQSDAVAVQSVSPPPPPKKTRCSQCGALVDPERGIVEEGGRIICPRCLGGSPIDTVSPARLRKLLLLGGIAGAVLVVSAAAYSLLPRTGTATATPEAHANTEPKPAAKEPQKPQEFQQPGRGNLTSSAMTLRQEILDSLTRRRRPSISAEPWHLLSADSKRQRFVKRVGTLPSAACADWQKVTGLSAQTLFFKLPEFDVLWDKDDQFQSSVSNRIVARFGNLPITSIDAWQKALGVDRVMLTYEILPDEDVLWDKDNQYQPTVAKRMIARIDSNALFKPEGTLREWTELTGQNLLEACFTLSALDSLFDNDRFKKEAFQDVLKTLKDELQKRKDGK